MAYRLHIWLAISMLILEEIAGDTSTNTECMNIEKLSSIQSQIYRLKSLISFQDVAIARQLTTIANLRADIAGQNTNIAKQDTEIAGQTTKIAKQGMAIAYLKANIAEQNTKLVKRDTEIERLQQIWDSLLNNLSESQAAQGNEIMKLKLLLRDATSSLDGEDKKLRRELHRITETITQLNTTSQTLKFKENEPVQNDNLALGKPTQQSSTLITEDPYWDGYSFTSDKAVDGNWGSFFEQSNSCTHTNNDIDPWWRVDLEREYPIKSVVVQNRGDCCGERFHDASVYVGNSLLSMELCGSFKGPGVNEQRITINCIDGTRGRYVKIQLGGRERLQLCEVAVYAV